MASATCFAPGLFAGAKPRIRPVADSGEIGRTLPRWKPGEMDLHFIYTGRGENMFYIFPDGTTLVNDVGDYWREKERAEIPWLPRADLLGGECVARYVKGVWDKPYVDYLTLSHWHNDHGGGPEFGTRKAADGREVCGIPLFDEFIRVNRFFDHQYPNRGQYTGGDLSTRKMIERWVEAKNIKQEPFRVGALNQIRLMNDPEGKFRDSFSVRNVCANAVCWTGEGDKTRDYGEIHAMATKREVIPNQNTLSMGFVVKYGNFRYWTGGDVSGFLKDENGRDFNFEAVVGKAVGRVSVCKTNHHAWKDAMVEDFVREVQAAAYVTAVWCPRHIQDCNMRHMASRSLYAGERMVFETFVPEWPRKEWPDAAWWKDVNPLPGGHVVVKVAEGGDTFKIYVVNATDESMTVTGVWEGIS
jgi:hypothetical protein